MGCVLVEVNGVSRCSNPDHEHFNEDGTPMECLSCGAPMFYDYRAESYSHGHSMEAEVQVFYNDDA